MPRKVRRKQWTDTEKEQMIRVTEPMAENQIRAYLKQQGIQMQFDSFRTLRSRHLRSHPEFAAQLAETPRVQLETEDFRAADRDRKRELVAEFRAVPIEQKAAWLEAHNTRRDLMQYYHTQFKKEAPKSVPPPSKAITIRRVLNGTASTQVLPPAPPRIPTLSDAILALEVERDHLNATIDKLKRMQGGY